MRSKCILAKFIKLFAFATCKRTRHSINSMHQWLSLFGKFLACCQFKWFLHLERMYMKWVEWIRNQMVSSWIFTPSLYHTYHVSFDLRAVVIVIVIVVLVVASFCWILVVSVSRIWCDISWWFSNKTNWKTSINMSSPFLRRFQTFFI